jgi:hypothetical protein
MTRPLRALGAAGLLLAASAVAVTVGGTAHADTQVCDKYGSTTVQNRYIVTNNVWGADTAQCINTTNSGFALTAKHQNPTNGGPASYPAIYFGCHYNNCSPGTNLPMQVSQISTATSSISYSYPGSGVYNAAYDIWLDPTPKKDGENKQELMIWFNRQGSIQPFGSRTGSATVGGRTWEVWSGSSTYRNVISYVTPSPITSWNFNILDFINDTKTRGSVTNSWYVTSIQAGFEPWVGGTGLAVTSFAASVNGGGGSTQQNTPNQSVKQPQPGGQTVPKSEPAKPVTPPRQPATQSNPRTQAKAGGRSYLVRAGDTLSTIAERQGVKGGWQSLYKLNREVVGADPDLIRPGQQLSL